MLYPYFEENDCLHLNPRHCICVGDPVKVEGMQGLWRYIRPVGDYDSGWAHIEVVGPYFPRNPSRNGGRSRIFLIDKVKYPGKRFKPIDVHDIDAKAASTNAKRAQRR